MENGLIRASPGWEIRDQDGTYQISVDLPGVKASDVTIEVENEGRVLHIYGGRKIEREDGVTETRFDQRFTVGDNIETDKIKANLAEGVLVLSAPKKHELPKRKIFITEKPHPKL